MIDFTIQLKSGADATALALLVAYSKEFAKFRFVYSTGLKVTRKGFNAAKPGKRLKDFLKIADRAYESLKNEGAAVNNESLRARINLFNSRLQWVGNELHLYDGFKIERHPINEGVNRSNLEKLLNTELSKVRPDTNKVIKGI